MKPKKFKEYSIEGKENAVYAYETFCDQKAAFKIIKDISTNLIVFVDYSYPVGIDIELIKESIKYAERYFLRIELDTLNAEIKKAETELINGKLSQGRYDNFLYSQNKRIEIVNEEIQKLAKKGE